MALNKPLIGLKEQRSSEADSVLGPQFGFFDASIRDNDVGTLDSQPNAA